MAGVIFPLLLVQARFMCQNVEAGGSTRLSEAQTSPRNGSRRNYSTSTSSCASVYTGAVYLLPCRRSHFKATHSLKINLVSTTKCSGRSPTSVTVLPKSGEMMNNLKAYKLKDQKPRTATVFGQTEDRRQDYRRFPARGRRSSE